MPTVRYETAPHLFAVGQTVRFRSRADRPPHSAETFQITRTLPPSAGLLQYRIRNDVERYERVTTEDRIELLRPGESETMTLEKRIFGPR